MKRTHLVLSVILSFAVLAFFANVMAQDAEKTQTQTQTKEQVKAQVKDGSGKTQSQIQTKTQTKEQVKAQVKDGSGLANQYKYQNKLGEDMDELARDHDGDGIPNGQDEDYDGMKFRASNGNKGFIDENGDGINDNAEDWDNDGIPNGQDEDFVRPQDGSGKMMQHRNKVNTQTGRSGGFGPGDGSGNSGIGPKDGSGNGPGTGDCSGTGNQTQQKGKGKS